MWSVRMRASKKENNIEKHISGAEGIYDYSQINRVLKQLFKRAFEHSKGKPDKVVITIERINDEIQTVFALPINTFFVNSPEEAFCLISKKLSSIGISDKAILSAFEVIKKYPMRGATLIDSITGERLERDKTRGIRVSRIHMDKGKRIKLIRQIKNLSTQPQRVIEAITIASKVASYPEVVAELCISDNPDYTIGYIASRDLGYLRITNIKNKGETIGGRAFFVKTPCDIEKLTNYLERKPVLVI
ncbi:6-carboxyhexanoate--CoA ligase [Thermodesulfovibrio yellowstonii]|uniref:6-carboxyhexanoate--CoA ligase n=1 Tax=Thermodesulfovibrio yellowstonii TaxID=28262 RepID=A0A9W6GGM9_9BACT|nr:6-carboxyhexanoate--CoA ligase [Thermodesulfovibrio islandicus]GLI53800.1 6-carboxyhexanoate--CoA ligase [Thermodesulfovibrio islandicus]